MDEAYAPLPSLVWGAIVGFASAAVVAVPLAALRVMSDTPALIAGSGDPRVGLLLFLSVWTLAGAFYGWMGYARIPRLATDDWRAGVRNGLGLGIAGGVAWWLGGSALIGRIPPLDVMALVETSGALAWGALTSIGLALVLDRYISGRFAPDAA